jgi:hypothetical protein
MRVETPLISLMSVYETVFLLTNRPSNDPESDKFKFGGVWIMSFAFLHLQTMLPPVFIE